MVAVDRGPIIGQRGEKDWKKWLRPREAARVLMLESVMQKMERSTSAEVVLEYNRIRNRCLKRKRENRQLLESIDQPPA